MSGDRWVQSVPLTKDLTQWDEVLMSKGIVTRDQCLLAKGFTPEQVLDIYAEEAQNAAEATRMRAAREALVSHPGESATIEELDELEEDELYADDAALAKYREARMRELKEAQERNRYGTVENIGREDWMREVNDASQDTWVLVHLYEDCIEACQILDAMLVGLAKEYRALKFVRIRARAAVENWPEDKVPVLFLYYHGEMKHQLFGHTDRRLRTDFTLANLKQLLTPFGIFDSTNTTTDSSRSKSFCYNSDINSDGEDNHQPRRSSKLRFSSSARSGAYDKHDDATWDKSEDEDILIQ
uniref:Phosducin domain-containing protein n=2 Tax=Aureoumbra lagunensis TaxID=44058 RepID=A0A7S3JXT9_9STRA|mmetsp:Transcript_23387/g.30350  ORF Transcript_23387/g.30350 Transcript_23387/m.30350 type:complete len:299 (+) Transcript_23387:81-977(+)